MTETHSGPFAQLEQPSEANWLQVDLQAGQVALLSPGQRVRVQEWVDTQIFVDFEAHVEIQQPYSNIVMIRIAQCNTNVSKAQASRYYSGHTIGVPLMKAEQVSGMTVHRRIFIRVQ